MPVISAKQAELARQTPLAGRVTCRLHEAAVLSGLALGKLQALVTAGHIESIKVGRARLIKVPSLLALLNTGFPPASRRRARR